MFRRKNAILAFLLVAVMLLSVGFAALSDTLTVYGVMQTDAAAFETAFDEAIYIESATVNEGQTTDTLTVEINRNPDDNDSIEFIVKDFAAVGDHAWVDVVIKNAHADLDAVLNVSVSELDGAEPECFTVGADMNYEVDGSVVAAGASVTLPIYVELKSTPTLEDATTGFTVSIVAEAAQN